MRSKSVSELRAWRAALEQLAGQIEQWSESRHWLVHRDKKMIREEGTRPYEVPYLVIQAPQGRIVVEPLALDVVGAKGRVNVYAWPSLEEILLLDFDKGWRVFDSQRNRVVGAWSERAFKRVFERLAAAA